MKAARSFVTDDNKSTTVDRVLVHGMSIRKAACRLIYNIFTLLTHYITVLQMREISLFFVL